MELPDGISTLKRPTLQKLCKAHNIKANLKNAEMIALLLNLKETKKTNIVSDSRTSPCVNEADSSNHGNKENEPLSDSPIVDDVSKHSGRKYVRGKRKKPSLQKERLSNDQNDTSPNNNSILIDPIISQDNETAHTTIESSTSDHHVTSDTSMEVDHMTTTDNVTGTDPLNTSDHMTSDTHHVTSEVTDATPINEDPTNGATTNSTSETDTKTDIDTANTDTDALSDDTEAMATDTDTVTADTDVMTTDTDTVTGDTDAVTADSDTVTLRDDRNGDGSDDHMSSKQDGNTVEASEEVKEKLNATFTIETLEEDMEDAHAVLSESIVMTPAKAECLNGSWASSASKDRPSATEESDPIPVPNVTKLAASSTATLPQSPLTKCVDHKSSVHNDIMDLLNKRVEIRKNDPNYKPPPTSDTATSKIPVKVSITSKFDKAHDKNFKKMQSIDQVASRKRQREEHQQEGDKTAKKSKVQCSSRITELATPKHINRRKTFNITESTKKSVTSKPFKKH